MNVIIKEIRISKELREKIDYWREWNKPAVTGIREGAGDGAARELAQLMHAELAEMNRLLRIINKEVHGVVPDSI